MIRISKKANLYYIYILQKSDIIYVKFFGFPQKSDQDYIYIQRKNRFTYVISFDFTKKQRNTTYKIYEKSVDTCNCFLPHKNIPFISFPISTNQY